MVIEQFCGKRKGHQDADYSCLISVNCLLWVSVCKVLGWCWVYTGVEWCLENPDSEIPTQIMGVNPGEPCPSNQWNDFIHPCSRMTAPYSRTLTSHVKSLTLTGERQKTCPLDKRESIQIAVTATVTCSPPATV